MNKNSLNQVNLIGRLGKDPEQQATTGGMSVSKFSIATTETRKDKVSGQYIDTTEWHNIVAFGKQAEFAGRYLRKGQLVYIEGRLKTSNWTDKNDVKHYKTDVLANVVTPLERADNQKPTQTYQQPTTGPQAKDVNGYTQGEEDGSDLPF